MALNNGCWPTPADCLKEKEEFQERKKRSLEQNWNHKPLGISCVHIIIYLDFLLAFFLQPNLFFVHTNMGASGS